MALTNVWLTYNSTNLKHDLVHRISPRLRAQQYLMRSKLASSQKEKVEFLSGSSTSYHSRQELTDASELLGTSRDRYSWFPTNRHRKHADAH